MEPTSLGWKGEGHHNRFPDFKPVSTREIARLGWPISP